MERKVYTITPLTGIHIGTGEELTLFDYTITDKIKNGLLYFKFSSDHILQRLMNDKQTMTDFYNASVVEGDMKKIQDFFQKHFTRGIDYYCDVTDGFKKLYDYQKAGKVSQMYHTEGKGLFPRVQLLYSQDSRDRSIIYDMQVPAIPGTSIKGAIRTALLNYFLKDLPDCDNYKSLGDIKLQQNLFEYGDAKNDPLRSISISDCLFEPADHTQLVGCMKVVYFDDKDRILKPRENIKIQAEVLKGALLRGSAVSGLSINIYDKLQKTPFALKKEGTRKPIKTITFKDIRESCNYFYLREFKNEYDKFYEKVCDENALIEKLKSRLEQAVNTNGQFIIRVGRWSQVEFVTFDKRFRKPVAKKGNDGKPRWGTKRTLLDYNGNYVPLGWCVLSEKEE